MMVKKRKRQIRNINSELPSSIIEVIFSKLPFYNLPSCRIVCKKWNHLILTCNFDPQISISNLIFARSRRKIVCLHFDPNPLKGVSTVASFNFHPKFFSASQNISILNSCNGILCFLIKKFTTTCSVCLLNPMTNEDLELPISIADRGKDYYYGLGFSPKTKQYKLVRSSMVLHDICGTLIEIFAFGTTPEWIPVCILPSFFNLNNFVYFNGGLYLVRHGRHRVIYRLDVEDEIITKISFPNVSGRYLRGFVFNSTLYLTIYGSDYLFHLWKMREDYSWIKVFVSGSIDESDFFRIIKVCEDGKILCLDHRFDFILYDPKSETKVILVDQHTEHKIWMAFLQMGSFNFNSLPKILAGNG